MSDCHCAESHRLRLQLADMKNDKEIAFNVGFAQEVEIGELKAKLSLAEKEIERLKNDTKTKR